MGTWGTSLYANDLSCDIRGDYLDKLRSGKTNEEVTQELIEYYLKDETDEEFLFWFALADTQWNYGRLLPDVKQKALYHLSEPDCRFLWCDESEKNKYLGMKH